MFRKEIYEKNIVFFLFWMFVFKWLKMINRFFEIALAIDVLCQLSPDEKFLEVSESRTAK